MNELEYNGHNYKVVNKVNITIQNGKITFIEQKGDELPNPMWDELVASITNVVERS